MKLDIKKVIIKTKYQGKIYAFSITGQLESGLTIKIFDHLAYDLRTYIGKKIDCLLITNDITVLDEESGKRGIIDNYEGKIDNPFILKGKIIENYKIAEKWLKFRRENIIINEIREEKYDAIKTNDGYFPIGLDDYYLNFDEEGDSYFEVGRFDLFAWAPLF